jgi:phosphoglycerate dehydrogenase-like enzyme
LYKIVSFFGDISPIFKKLNNQAGEYAKTKNMDYIWAPQTPFNQDEVIKLLEKADAGIIDVEPYGEDIFSCIDNSARLLVRFGVGYDKVDLEAASRHGIAIARTTGANTLSVAEMALTLILTVKRRIRENQEIVKKGKWEKIVVRETLGSTIGILGFGAIGQALAGLLSGFGCRIIAHDPYPNKEAAARYGVEFITPEELFKNSDAISLHIPYSKETHNLVGYSLLSIMKPSAIIVNTSRGNILDEEALYRILKEKRIAGAGLDVYSREPLPLNSPLLTLENIVLTPHVSSQTEESLWRIYTMAIDIISDFFEGKDSAHILNPDYKEYKRRPAK